MVKKQKQPRIPRYTQHTTDIENAVADAMSELSGLGEELRSWYDNMPENFQNGDKGSMVDEAANTLESLNEVEVPACLSTVPVAYQSDRKAQSRSARCGEAVNMLNIAKDNAQAFLDENLPEDETKDTETQATQREEIDSFISELDEVISEAEGVEFPGMFG